MPANSNHAEQRRKNPWRKIRLKAYWGKRLLRKYEAFAIVTIGCLIFYIIAALYLQALDNTYLTLEQKSLFGNVFNGLNTVVSALAFAVLVYTAILQRKELSLQREELRATREEFAKQSKEFEDQNKISIKSSYYSNLFSLIEICKNVKESIYLSNYVSIEIDGKSVPIQTSNFEGGAFRILEQLSRFSFAHTRGFNHLGSGKSRLEYFEKTDISLLQDHKTQSLDILFGLFDAFLRNYFQQIAFVYAYMHNSRNFNNNWSDDVLMFEAIMTREEKVCLIYWIIMNRKNTNETMKYINSSLFSNHINLLVFNPNEDLSYHLNQHLEIVVENIIIKIFNRSKK